MSCILIVDDDASFREALTAGLARQGHTVRAVADGVAALAMAEQAQWDAAVLDLRLAQESGLDLIVPLRQRQPGLRILLLTGYASIVTAVEAIKLGAVDYLPKPASVEAILAVLECDLPNNTTTETANAPMSVNRLEWEHIQRVLAEHDGNISATARALKMHRRTLQRKLMKHPVRA
jgi:two-component system response regulator RegA